MALTLTVETGAGLTTSNSYATVVNGNDYHDARLHVEDWTGASTANKEKALVWATSLLDANLEYAGYKKDEDQALRWPRTGTYDKDGYVFDDDEIPQILIDATCEYARILLAEDITAAPDTLGFSEMKVGSLALKIDKTDRDSIGVIPDSVLSIISAIGATTSGIQSTVDLVRV